MNDRFLLSLPVLFAIVIVAISTPQVLPYYSTSTNFYCNQAVAPVGNGVNTYSLPATFPISTASHRLPFYAIMYTDNMKTYFNQTMYFWTQIATVSSTSMTMSIYFRIVNITNTSGTYYYFYGFEAPSTVKFRYLLVLDTFPNKYISMSYYQSIGLSLPANSFTTLNISLPTIVTPPPLTLNSTDTVFIHTLSWTSMNSTLAVYNSSFQQSLSFSVINTTDFSVNITLKYPVILNQIQITVFIFNKADFANQYVKIDYQRFTYRGLGVGTSADIVQSYTSSFDSPLTTDVLFGIQGLQMSGYINTGFSFTITQINGSNFNIKLLNLWATSTIPRLDLFTVLPSQFRCPYLETLIDVTLTICYNTSCPASTFNSTQVLGVTGINVCNPCISNCLACQTLANNCTSCNTTAYLSASNTCVNCSSTYPNCASCTLTNCTACISGFGLAGNALSCIICSTYSQHCLTCTGSVCQSCNTAAGYVLSANSLTCISCTTFDQNCVSCNYSVCLSCASGFSLAPNGTCQSCSIYGQQCTDCNQNSCITCSQGYIVHQFKCKSSNFVCGDGIWVYPQEICDDGNLVNGDGCDSQCQVEQDYQCLITDQLPSGISFCKFTKNITIDLTSLQKEDSANKLHIFLTLGPSTFKQWTQQSISQLLNPIEILDSNGNVIQIPSSNINLVYHKNEQTGQIQLIIDYGQNNLDGGSINFNNKPNQTNLNTLQGISAQNSLLLKLNSQGFGFYFYGYPPETYQKQNIIQILSRIVGILSLIFAFLGLFIPGGKLIVLQALTVIQIGYFSILSFQNIPPTFLGLKCLNLSNGFNDLNLISSGSQIVTDIFSIMGLNTVIFSNYNLTLILFVIIPIIIGSIGLIIKFKRSNRIQNEYNSESVLNLNVEIKNDVASNSSSQSIIVLNQQPSLGLIIFERILYENTFYGLYFGGYLAWVSIIHSLTQPHKFDYIFLVVIAVILIAYTILFIRSQNNQISLTAFSSSTKREKKQQKHCDNSELKISTQFGQFGDMYKQFIPSAESQIMKKIYLALMAQKLINSVLLALLPRSFNFVNALLIGVYLVELAIMIILHKKLKNQEPPKGKESVFSYIYQNYVLRQSANFMTIILIEALYLCAKIFLKEQGPYQAFVNNKFVSEGVPLCIVLILMSNFCFNVFCWVWQLKSDRIIEKSKIVLELMFPKVFGSSNEALVLQKRKCKDNIQVTIENLN